MGPYFFVALIDNVSVVSGANVPFHNVMVEISQCLIKGHFFSLHNGYQTPHSSMWYAFVSVHCVISQRIIVEKYFTRGCIDPK